ncbi:uncharacterized protein [Antedon mediterranea]|uniref:uncharacterized protein isoform X2 n=1 Tax=Antedon mediterranea TaxID=105859 RepID=UPI003AF7191A
MMDEATFDTGAYRAHFRRWWQEGRGQREGDDDAMETIEKRLMEVTDMVTPKKSVENAMERMGSPMREKVREFCTITPDTFKRIRSRQRKHRKALLRFRSATCLVIILTRAFRMRKKYFNTKKKASQTNGDGSNRSEAFATNLQTVRSANFKNSVALELQLYLTNLPEHRKEKEIRKIIYYLRATKAFTMFSSRVEEDLARHIGYDCYDDGRIIAFQGRVPDRFYYVISGRVQLIHQYKLQSGVINKVMATLRKGSCTDGEELEHQWLRQCSLVCKGMVEVLVLEKQDYFELRNTILGPPIEFLRSVDLFKDFPIEMFHEHPEAIQYKYYSPDKLIVDDTNQTRDVFIVKSGSCKCIRKQWVTDVSKDRRCNNRQGINKLGYVKTSSHADAMLGTSWKKMVLSGQTNFVLPQIPKADSTDSKSHLNQHRNTLGLQQNCRSRVKHRESIHSTIDMPALALVEPNSGMFNRSKDLNRNSSFMTQRSRTELSSRTSQPKRVDHVQERLAYIQVDALRQGDIFGLNDLQSGKSSERSCIAVWSEGAEIVAINKRFFKNNANTPTMLRIDMLIRDWMSEEDASNQIGAQETWQNYKSVLMERMAEQRNKLSQAKALTTMYS